MDQMVNYIVQIPMFQSQFFQLLAERMDFFGCQLFIDDRGSRASSRPGRFRFDWLAFTASSGGSATMSCTEAV
jgi:hypothetical protein